MWQALLVIRNKFVVNKSYEVNQVYLSLLSLYFGISSTLLIYDSKYIFGIYIYICHAPILNRYRRILFSIFISCTTWHSLHFNCHIAEFASLHHFHQWFKRIFNFLRSKYQLKLHNYTAGPVKVHNTKLDILLPANV